MLDGEDMCEQNVGLRFRDWKLEVSIYMFHQALYVVRLYAMCLHMWCTCTVCTVLNHARVNIIFLNRDERGLIWVYMVCFSAKPSFSTVQPKIQTHHASSLESRFWVRLHLYMVSQQIRQIPSDSPRANYGKEKPFVVIKICSGISLLL